MGVYMFLLPRVPLSMFSSVEYQKWGFWHRLEYMYLSGFTARWKYYFIWSIAEVAVTISGLGFSGWTTSPTSSEPKPKWTRAKNIDIMKVELAKSGVELPIFWNISVSTWLRHCILSVDGFPVQFSSTISRFLFLSRSKNSLFKESPIFS